MTTNAMHFTVRADKLLTALEQPSLRVIEIQIKAPAAQTRQKERLPLNLALVLDTSGSMNGAKIEYAKLAACHVAELLTDKDRAALATYCSEAELRLPGEKVTAEYRLRLLAEIMNLRATSSTNLSGGWLLGCEAVALHQHARQINRALLLSDGLANMGITDIEQLGAIAADLHERGISTSTFGIGQGFDERLMERIANQGGGNFYFIEHPAQIPDIFQSELGELLTTTASGMVLHCTLPLGVQVEVLGGWRSKTQEQTLSIHLGDLASEQSRSIYLLATLPAGSPASGVSVSLTLDARDENSQPLRMAESLVFQYAPGDVCEQAAADEEMMARYSKMYLSDVTREALWYERMGQRDRAREMIQNAVDNTAAYLRTSDRERFERRRDRMGEGLSEEERKRMHYNTYRNARSRPVEKSEEDNE